MTKKALVVDDTKLIRDVFAQQLCPPNSDGFGDINIRLGVKATLGC